MSTYTTSALKDFIHSLPRSPVSISNQFSGYLSISSVKRIHYHYVESEKDPSIDPVIFWTNGGPGCSGLLGLFTEFGPWRPTPNGGLAHNFLSWTSMASIVFLEQPVGVGFSYYTDNSPKRSSDIKAAADNLAIIQAFFKKFPERGANAFYLASESYGGHYMPQASLAVLNSADASLTSRFRGMIVGNPFTSFGSGSIAMADTFWGLQVTDGYSWRTFSSDDCGNLQYNAQSYPDICYDHLNSVLGSAADSLNPYAVEFPVCGSGSSYTDQSENKGGDMISSTSSPRSSSDASSSSSRSSMQRGEAGIASRSDAYRTKISDTTSTRTETEEVPSPQAQRLLQLYRRVFAKERTLRRKTEHVTTASHEHIESDTTTKHQMATAAAGGESAAVDRNKLMQRTRRRTQPLQRINVHDIKASGLTLPDNVFRLHEEISAPFRLSRLLRVPGIGNITDLKYDPCTDQYLQLYLRDPEVISAMHVSESGMTSWQVCDDDLFAHWPYHDEVDDTTALYSHVLQHPNLLPDFKMLVFSGDVDAVCGTVGTQHWIYKVETRVDPPTEKALWQPWYWVPEDMSIAIAGSSPGSYSVVIGGFVTRLSPSLVFATVHNAGHEVAGYQPSPSLAMLSAYFDGSLFVVGGSQGPSGSGGSGDTMNGSTPRKSASDGGGSHSLMLGLGIAGGIVVVVVVIVVLVLRRRRVSRDGRSSSSSYSRVLMTPQLSSLPPISISTVTNKILKRGTGHEGDASYELAEGVSPMPKSDLDNIEEASETISTLH